MSSDPFGQVRASTRTFLTDTVQVVRTQILKALPSSADAKVRALTLEAVLKIVLRDWSENGNESGLLPEDIADLTSFVALAANLAGPDLSGRGTPVYAALLQGLLEDWLANWNADGVPGPPRR